MKRNKKTFKYVLFKNVLIITLLLLVLYFAINRSIDFFSNKIYNNFYQFNDQIKLDKAKENLSESQKMFKQIGGEVYILDNENKVIYLEDIKKSFSYKDLVLLQNGTYKKEKKLTGQYLLQFQIKVAIIK